MTEEIFRQIVSTKKLPKDELNNFWSNLFGYIPLIIIFLIIIILVYTNSASFLIVLITSLLFILILSYSIWFKLNERKLKKIITNLSQNNNEIIIEKLIKKMNIIPKTNKGNYKELYIPFILGHKGHKLTILAINNEILYNIRSFGSDKGRLPFMLWIDIKTERKFKNQLESFLFN